jgi:mono/diheme cytochrome c family protein
LRGALLAAVALLLVIQLVPYGRDHSNPPVTREPAWDSARTRALVMRACGDCHTNQTTWPWYSNVAPVSWLVQRDTDVGRAALNFSTWDRPQDSGAGDIVDAARGGGGMPPWFYTLIHRNAALSPADQAALVHGLQATLAASPPVGGGGG